MSLGKRECKTLLDTLMEADMWLTLHTGHPGEDGQTANAVTGTGYAAEATVAADWTAATDASPSVKVNANAVTFGPAGAGGWASGSPITHVALWNHTSGRAEANYIGAMALAVSKVMSEDDTLEFAAGDLQMTLT